MCLQPRPPCPRVRTLPRARHRLRAQRALLRRAREPNWQRMNATARARPIVQKVAAIIWQRAAGSRLRMEPLRCPVQRRAATIAGSPALHRPEPSAWHEREPRCPASDHRNLSRRKRAERRMCSMAEAATRLALRVALAWAGCSVLAPSRWHPPGSALSVSGTGHDADRTGRSPSTRARGDAV